MIVLTLTIIIGGTYAWLTLTLNGTKSNVLRAGMLQLTLDDTTSDGISLENSVPVSDEKGLISKQYTFTLENKGSASADYTIYLDDLPLNSSENRMLDKYVKYSLTKNDDDVNVKKYDLLYVEGANSTFTFEKSSNVIVKFVDSSGTEQPGMMNSMNEAIKSSGSSSEEDAINWVKTNYCSSCNKTSSTNYGNLELENIGANPNRTLDSGVINSKTTNTYTLKMWISSEADNAVMGTIFYGQLRVEATQHISTAFTGINYTQALTNIEFQNTINKPDNTAFEYDVSKKQDKSVMQYNVLNDDGSYTAYIQANGKIGAPENSSFLFSHQSVESVTGLKYLDTSNVTNMKGMFAGTNISTVDISTFDTSNVTDMSYMFNGCSNLTNVDINKLNFSNVTTLEDMFYGNNSLQSLDFSGVKMNNVTTVFSIVYGCSNIKEINLNNLTANKLQDVNQFFNTTSSSILEKITANNMTLNSITELGYGGGMGLNSNLKSVSMNHLSSTSLNLIKYILPQYSDNVIESFDMSYLDAPNMTSFEQAFLQSKVKSFNLSHMKIPKVTTFQYMFDSTKSIESIDFTGTNVSGLENTSYMFNNSEISGALDLTAINPTNLSNVNMMFYGAKNLTSIDMRNWSSGKIEYASSVFNNATSLTTIYINGLDFLNASINESVVSGLPSTVNIHVKDEANKTKFESILHGSGTVLVG